MGRGIHVIKRSGEDERVVMGFVGFGVLRLFFSSLVMEMASDAGGGEEESRIWSSVKVERFCDVSGFGIEGRRREGRDEGEAALGRDEYSSRHIPL